MEEETTDNIFVFTEQRKNKRLWITSKKSKKFKKEVFTGNSDKHEQDAKPLLKVG